MSRKSKAAVCRQLNEPVVVEEVEVESPRPNEVMIEMKACGVCHSDLSATNGTFPTPPPTVLGHEACAKVIETGEGVDDLAIGDSVIIAWIPMCGECRYCTMGRPALCEMRERTVLTLPDGTRRLKDSDGNELNHLLGVAVMSEYATVHRNNLVKIDPEVPPTAAALVSCAVMTGVGAVVNTAKVEPGSTVVVFGTGGVGLNAVQGAVLADAEKIIAVDLDDKKLELAVMLGATHTINSTGNSARDTIKAIKKICPGGVDYAFECIGLGTTILQAYQSLRKGGTAVVVGVSKLKETIELGTFTIPFYEKVLTGSLYGSAKPTEDFPRLLEHYKCGRLKLDELVTATYSIDEAPRAFEDLEKGLNARGVIVF